MSEKVEELSIFMKNTLDDFKSTFLSEDDIKQREDKAIQERKARGCWHPNEECKPGKCPACGAYND